MTMLIYYVASSHFASLFSANYRACVRNCEAISPMNSTISSSTNHMHGRSTACSNVRSMQYVPIGLNSNEIFPQLDPDTHMLLEQKKEATSGWIVAKPGRKNGPHIEVHPLPPLFCFWFLIFPYIV
jgi:hypothetical protein